MIPYQIQWVPSECKESANVTETTPPDQQQNSLSISSTATAQQR